MLEKTVDLGNGTIERTDGEAMVGDIQDQILAHHGQTNEAKIRTGYRPRRSADIEAGETGAVVSTNLQSDHFRF